MAEPNAADPGSTPTPDVVDFAGIDISGISTPKESDVPDPE